MIRTKGQVLEEIRNSPKMWKTFCGWEEKYQQEYLDICTGVKGVKLLYDTYFKVIMNPDTRPERLNDFLSEILGRKIRILKVLPNESARIAAESSFRKSIQLYYLKRAALISAGFRKKYIFTIANKKVIQE